MRRRRASPASRGLAAGEKLKREGLQGSQFNLWSWVGTEVTSAAEITDEHLMFCCGLSERNGWPICRNKYSKVTSPEFETSSAEPTDVNEDIVVISDDEKTQGCSRRACRLNPNCLNYLGQDAWENEEKAREAYLKAANLKSDPRDDMRTSGSPVGLKNLGATCYANAFLQVWFQDLAFRTGVYKYLPSQDIEHEYQISPVFQLQVTFAAMQEGLHKVFNPVKLVESLQLRTTEQQDAQEFSKLFMSYLDTEFKKQSEPSLKTLIPDQFQGTQVYGTECQNCHNRSERNSEFFELEIHLEHNCKLEDRIGALLQPEILSGDNKYLCSHCDSLQDATRYAQLRQLPPVLHISLLRFVYDLSSMERKKCSHAVTFPMVLNMDQFLDARLFDSGGNRNRNVYHLRGVLLHRGPSAWHGHYEAQVYDVASKQWYQFDDESVTKPKSMAYLFDEADVDVEGESKTVPKTTKVRTGRQGTKRKRQTRDGEKQKQVVIEHTLRLPDRPSREIPPSQGASTKPITSKEAYMLVYVRETSDSDTPPKVNVSSPPPTAGGHAPRASPPPPLPAMEVINRLNAELVKSVEEFNLKKKEKTAEFGEFQQRMRDAYGQWMVSSYAEPSVIASADLLEKWLSTGLTDAEPSLEVSKLTGGDEQTGEEGTSVSTSQLVPVPLVEQTFSNSDIICHHGLLDPRKAGGMKRLKKSAYERIRRMACSTLLPELSSRDACRICATELFKEQLYQREHPKLVAQFNKLCTDDRDSKRYWISKTWLKDWKLSKPKMHQPGSQDPAPDSVPFALHVRCEHGGLCLDSTLRRTIPEPAYDMLKAYFLSWQTLSVEDVPCAICEISRHGCKEEQSELKGKAELEKTRLSNLYDSALEHYGDIPFDSVSAVVPAEFVSAWRRWVRQPHKAPRPGKLDNSSFFCQHGMLLLDPETTDMDGPVALASIEEWKALEDLYLAGPLISIEKRHDEGGHRIIRNVDVCQDCRIQRKSEYTTTEINVRIYGEQSAKENTGDADYRGQASSIVTYESRGTRRSKRIRKDVPKRDHLKIIVSKDTTIKDLRFKVQEESGVPSICQRLFCRDQELDDSSATIGGLGILSNDIIDVRQQSQEALDETLDTTNKRPRLDDGKAFDGTMLGRQCDPQPNTRVQQDIEPVLFTDKECSVCTYRNAEGAGICIMCDTQLT
ncbi:cysteine proteinase [Neolentinus lepideus HHB14362 ss-1]|uniref:ubiquitinyl hydrolase 1 n=1 Tax=Neolentinus lepideus HHB14362 ss-1 TaxID=1314782 RepID=A0A165UN67_9AGAM|nr:cysteine proteinase [Neolentinus lepideus HHB14362 ss-1]